MKLKPTQEQQKIIDTFIHVSRPDLVINASAGSGKTTTFLQLGEALLKKYPQSHARYVTLNKRNAEEVKEKFLDSYGGSNVTSSTMHSLAYRGVVNKKEWIAERLQETPLPQKTLAEDFVTEGFEFVSIFTNETVFLDKVKVYQLVLEMVSKFCQSDRQKISAKDTPFISGYVEQGKNKGKLADFLLPIANKVWADICSSDGLVKFTHDYYLKMFHLSSPVIGKPGDVIFYDEAQDAKPCIADIIMQQDHVQKVFCGDTFQAIYGFTGAVDSLRKFAAVDDVINLDLSMSFRFGQGVADSANSVLRYLNEDPMPLVGNPSLTSTVSAYSGDSWIGKVDAVITRSNAELIEVIVDLLSKGISFHAVVDIGHIINVCDDIELMQNDQKPQVVPELKELETIGNLYSILEKERTDSKVLLQHSSLYRVIIAKGSQYVKQAVSSGVSESEADVVVSTMHKSKGREWDNVAVFWSSYAFFPQRFSEDTINNYGDFFYSGAMAEVMLLYVAVTRGKKSVLVPEELARRVGITVNNQDQWEEQWIIEDLVDWIRFEGKILPRRNGHALDIPDLFYDVQLISGWDRDMNFAKALEIISEINVTEKNNYDDILVKDLDF